MLTELSLGWYSDESCEHSHSISLVSSDELVMPHFTGVDVANFPKGGKSGTKLQWIATSVTVECVTWVAASVTVGFTWLSVNKKSTERTSKRNKLHPTFVQQCFSCCYHLDLHTPTGRLHLNTKGLCLYLVYITIIHMQDCKYKCTGNLPMVNDQTVDPLLLGMSQQDPQ